MQHLD